MSVSPPTRAIPDNLADLVGNTPMVRLTRVAPDCGAELIGKLEAYNPAGSVKDRIGVSMIDVAEAEGRIEPGRNTIVESTSGNTGIALAFVCAAKGYDLILTMPQGMSREREGLLRLYGAQVQVGRQPIRTYASMSRCARSRVSSSRCTSSGWRRSSELTFKVEGTDTAGGVRLDPIQLWDDLEREFGGGLFGLVQNVVPSEVYLHSDVLWDAGATGEDVAVFLRDYPYRRNIGPYVPRGVIEQELLDRQQFAAVFATSFLDTLAGRQLDADFGPGIYPDGDPSGVPPPVR